MGREDDIRLICASHRVSREEAEAIIEEIESGRRKVISADDLAAKAGVGRSGLRKSTRSIGRLFGDSLMSLEQPARGAIRRDNGRRPLGEATAKGLG